VRARSLVTLSFLPHPSNLTLTALYGAIAALRLQRRLSADSLARNDGKFVGLLGERNPARGT